MEVNTKETLFQQGATRPMVAQDGHAQHTVAAAKALEMSRSHEEIRCHSPSSPGCFGD